MSFDSVSQSVSVVVFKSNCLPVGRFHSHWKADLKPVVQNLIKCFERLWLSSAWVPRTRHFVAHRGRHNPQTHPIKPKCANFDPIFASNSKTAHFERKRWAPPFKPCPRGVHWWWSRPNWLSWRREPWLGPSKKCHLGPLWMEGKNCPRGSEKLMGTARANRGSDISFSAPELKN